MHTSWRPTWILLGGCLLAFGAAAVNACFLMEINASVSHLTGDLSRFAHDLLRPEFREGEAIWNLGTAMCGFVSGAMLAGYTIHHPKLELTSPYGWAIAGIGVSLVGAWLLIGRWPHVAVTLAAAACGFQNALATHFRGVILRTTHVTGLLTDLGVVMGMRLRGHHIPYWKIAIPLALVMSFFVGAAAGALGALLFGAMTILYLGIGYLLGGIFWIIIKPRVLHLAGGASGPSNSHPHP